MSVKPVEYAVPASIYALSSDDRRRYKKGKHFFYKANSKIIKTIMTVGPNESEWARMTVFLPGDENPIPGVVSQTISTITFDYSVNEMSPNSNGGWVFKPSGLRIFNYINGIVYTILQASYYPNATDGKFPYLNIYIKVLDVVKETMQDFIIMRGLHHTTSKFGEGIGIKTIFQLYSPREYAVNLLRKHGFTNQQIFQLDMIIYVHRIVYLEGTLPEGTRIYLMGLMKVLIDAEYQYNGKVGWGDIETVFENWQVPNAVNQSLIVIKFAEKSAHFGKSPIVGEIMFRW